MKPSRVTSRDPRLSRYAKWLAMVLSVVAVNAAAQVMADPMRPPANIGGGLADPGTAAAGGMTLQSVMISPTQKTAIISGVVVKLGEKYGDAVLVSVAESEVVLKSDGARQVLKLYPGVEKRAIAPAGAARRR